MISGTPSVAGSSSFTLKVTDASSASASQALTLNVIASGIRLNWSLNEGSGTVAGDSSGNGNNGTLFNGPVWSAGKVGGALSFDGVSSYVGLSNVAGLVPGNTPHTIAAWVKVNALPSNRAWILLLGNEGNGAHHWLINSAGGTQFGVWGGGQVNPTLPVGTWVHVATTFDGTTLSGYVNGVLIGTSAASFNLTGMPLSLAQQHLGENYFNGQLDEVRVYDYALSAAEVAALVSAPLGVSTSTLPNGTVGTAYTQTLAATGGTPPYTWSVSAGTLPAGLTLNTTTGVISGTPSVASSSSFTVKVQDTLGATATQPLSIVVNPSAAPLTISTTTLSSGTVGTTYSQTLAATGGTAPYTWSVSTGTLPAGLTLNTTTGVISGTPSVAGSSSFTLKVTDASSASASQSITLTVTSAGAAGPYNYTYDEVGRLIAMTDSAGNAVQYDYDAVGNLIAIKRPGASSVSIIDFTPDTGTNGTGVTITGTGFSTTPSLNTVNFNGLGATVNSATVNQLVVTAPVGVSSGPISVTTPLGSDISSTNFLVGGASLGAPTITSFTPTVGTPGTTVTITGTNFDTGLVHTKVRFNQTPAFSTSVTSTTNLTTVVPANAASGKIRIITPAGYVDSVADFIIPPPGIAAGDIVDIKRLLVGGTLTLNIAPTNKAGLVLVDGGTNVYMTLNITTLTTIPAASLVAYQVYSPNGSLVASGNVSDSSLSIHLPSLAQTGTYSIYFKPGAATATLYIEAAKLVADPTLMLDGVPTNVSIAQTWQTARLTFTGNVGQTLGLGITGLTLNPTSSTSANVSVYMPNGELLSYQTCYTTYSGCTMNLRNLPLFGTYSVVVTPAAGGIGGFTATLSTQVVANLLLDGAPSTVSITRAGQSARLIFTGSVGQYLGLGITGLTLNPESVPSGSAEADVNVYKPDTSGLTGIACFTSATASGGCLVNTGSLPTSGTYSVEVAPSLAETGSFKATLSSDVVGTLTPGTAFNLNLSRAGQIGRLTFNGAAGDILGLALSGVTVTPAGGGYVSVLLPNGTFFSSLYFGDGIMTAQTLPRLPTSGTYTVLINPDYAATVDMTLLLSHALPVPLLLDGASSNVTLATVGQPAQMTFNGIAGQNLGLGITGLTLSPSTLTSTQVAVYFPNGTLWNGLNATGCDATAPGCELILSNLPMTGTYSVVMSPTSGITGGTGSFTATLSSDVTGALTAGIPFNLNLSRAGQNGRLTFSGTAGTSPTLTFSAISTIPAGQSVNFTVYQPNGSFFTGVSGATFVLPSLPATGTYTLFVDPSFGATAMLSVTLSP